MTHALRDHDAGAGSLPFRASAALTLGVELELGIVDRDGFDLAPGAPILLASLARDGFDRHVKAEITRAMIEVNSSVHANVATLQEELHHLTSTLATYAERFGLRVVGGGTHPFQEWSEQEVFPAPRFAEVSRRYGYLARQFTVFGQHVHVGCVSGDDALYLSHALTRYVPHFIALAASSPFWRGVDTGYECCRLNVVSAFPLSGLGPPVRSWREFEVFYDNMRRRNIVSSMKDFYWDIRPKPEFGTVELRVCDTPLRVVDAVDMAALLQALAAELLSAPRRWEDEHFEWIYARNRFQASRYGLDGEYIDQSGIDGMMPLRESMHMLLEHLEHRFIALGAADAHGRLRDRVDGAAMGSAWLRRRFAESRDLCSVVSDMSTALLAAA